DMAEDDDERTTSPTTVAIRRGVPRSPVAPPGPLGRGRPTRDLGRGNGVRTHERRTRTLRTARRRALRLRLRLHATHRDPAAAPARGEPVRRAPGRPRRPTLGP